MAFIMESGTPAVANPLAPLDPDLSLVEGQILDVGPGLSFSAEVPGLDGGEPPALFDQGTLPLMHQRLVDALADAGVDNLQLFPATLRRADGGGEWSDYHAFNVVGRVRAVDAGQSEVETIPADPDNPFYRSLVLDEAAAGISPLFRLAEVPGVIVVSDAVRAAIERAGITGLAFFGPGEWSG